jgi:hypothetical protein
MCCYRDLSSQRAVLVRRPGALGARPSEPSRGASAIRHAPCARRHRSSAVAADRAERPRFAAPRVPRGCVRRSRAAVVNRRVARGAMRTWRGRCRRAPLCSRAERWATRFSRCCLPSTRRAPTGGSSRCSVSLPSKPQGAFRLTEGPAHALNCRGPRASHRERGRRESRRADRRPIPPLRGRNAPLPRPPGTIVQADRAGRRRRLRNVGVPPRVVAPGDAHTTAELSGELSQQRTVTRADCSLCSRAQVRSASRTGQQF